jgi:Trypsin
MVGTSAHPPSIACICLGLLLSVAAVECEAAAEPAPEVEAVGALVDDGQSVFCTGSLLSADTVLTAAHCVAREGAVRWPYGFLRGEDVRLGGELARVLDGAVHPEYDDFLHSADLAVLRIAGGAPRAATLAVDGDVPRVGSAVRIFGFGAGAVAPNRRDAEVTGQVGDSFRYQPGTCPGDSGGPVLAGDGATVAGVVSTGDAGCSTARAVAVAAHADWIGEAIEYLDPSACRSGDGVCGEDCRLGDTDCPCVDDDGACRLCAGSDPECGRCASDGVCTDSCLAPDPDCRTLDEGAVCERDIECASSVCAEGACRVACTVDSGTECPPWAECVATGDEGDGVCIPYSDAQLIGSCGAAPSGGGAAAELAPLILALAVAGRAMARGAVKCDRQRKGDRR